LKSVISPKVNTWSCATFSWMFTNGVLELRQ